MKKLITLLLVLVSTFNLTGQVYKYNAFCLKHYQSDDYQIQFDTITGDQIHVENPKIQIDIDDDVFELIKEGQLSQFGVHLTKTVNDTLTVNLDSMYFEVKSPNGDILIEKTPIISYKKEGKYIKCKVLENDSFILFLNTDYQPEDKYKFIFYYTSEEGFNKEKGLFSIALIENSSPIYLND